MKCSTCVYMNHGQILYSRFQHGYDSHFFLNATVLQLLGKFYRHYKKIWVLSTWIFLYRPTVSTLCTSGFGDGWLTTFRFKGLTKGRKTVGIKLPQSKYNISCNVNMSLFAQKMDKLSILSTTVVFCLVKFLVVAHNQCQATREKTLCCA